VNIFALTVEKFQRKASLVHPAIHTNCKVEHELYHKDLNTCFLTRNGEARFAAVHHTPIADQQVPVLFPLPGTSVTNKDELEPGFVNPGRGNAKQSTYLTTKKVKTPMRRKTSDKPHTIRATGASTSGGEVGSTFVGEVLNSGSV